MQYNPPHGAPGLDDPYVNGDPSIGRQGSIPPAASIEFPQREIVNLIAASDQLPTNDDLHQLTRGIRNQWINFCVDSGAVNALSVALMPTLREYSQGLPLRVLVANDNTGPSTINVNSLGNRPILRATGANLEPGDLRAGMIALLVDDGTQFQMVNFLGAGGGAGGGAGEVNTYYIHIPYAEDTSAQPSVINAGFLPPITAVAPGDVVLVKVANRNTGPVTININTLAGMPIRRNDNQPLEAGDILADEAILIEYNTSFWQMLRLVRSQVWFRLAADLLLYVRIDGNDLNDGSVNDAAHAFRTVQGAIDFVKKSYLIAGRSVLIQLGMTGTYVGNIVITDIAGSITIRGDPNNMLGYVLQGAPQSPSFYMLYSSLAQSVTVEGVLFSLIDPTYDGVAGANLGITNCAFGGVGLNQGHTPIYVGGITTLYNNIHMYQSSAGGFAKVNLGMIQTAGFTLINTHGCTFHDAFVTANMGGIAQFYYGYCSFTGGAFGRRYVGAANSVIYTAGGPADFLPGNQPGVLGSGAVIV